MERPRTRAQAWLRIRLPLVSRPVRRPTQLSVSDEEDKDAEGEVKVEPREEEEENQEAVVKP